MKQHLKAAGAAGPGESADVLATPGAPPRDRVIILDAGVVGLTLAESLANRGVRVTQLVSGDRFWPEMLDEGASRRVEALLEEHGVTVCRHTTARLIVGAGARAIGVETTQGDLLAAELVAYGSRRRPAVGLLAGSGIEVRRGICVNAALGTSDPDVFAAGDVAEPKELPDAEDERTPFCWQRAWTQGAVAAASMLGQRGPLPSGTVRVRTEVLGRELAVLGAGHLPEGWDRSGPEGGKVEAVQVQDPPGTYRRLVFRRGQLVGAIVFGAGESVHELDHLVAERATREDAEKAIGLSAAEDPSRCLTQTCARHCPICAAELVIRRGTRIGSCLSCEGCSTDLVVRWDGASVWLQVSRP